MKKLLLTSALLLPTLVWAEDVTIANLVRAESDHMMRENMRVYGVGLGEIIHLREPTTTDNQAVIRMNQDTLYSGLLLDLSVPVQVTMPEVDGRYMSMMVISQDHYITSEATPGTYELTEENVGTRFAFIGLRTFADVTDPADVAAAHKAQDAFTISGGGAGPFEAPDWNLDQLDMARKAINDVSTLGFDSALAYGTKDVVEPVNHLIGAVSAWGGLPAKAAIYVVDAVSKNDGMTPYSVTLDAVPVRAFWSVTVYNADGRMEANDLGVNSYNNYTAQPSDDGTVTLHFGGCKDGRNNCIPITPNWNYAVRLYEPEPEIIDGTWTFPLFEPVD
jgi:hypothetical protein